MANDKQQKTKRKKVPLFDLRHIAFAFGVDEKQLRRGKEVPLKRGKPRIFTSTFVGGEHD